MSFSSFIAGARTNLNYDQLLEATQRANPRCTICDKPFQSADRVHVLGCSALGHVFHRPCLNPLLAKGRKVLQIEAGVERKEIEGGGDVIGISLEGIDLRTERNCPRASCLRPIRLHEENVQKGAYLHREINGIPPNQLSSYSLDVTFRQQQEDQRLLFEYLQTFSPEEHLLIAKEKQRKQSQMDLEQFERNCNRIAIVAGIGVGLFVAIGYLYPS